MLHEDVYENVLLNLPYYKIVEICMDNPKIKEYVHKHNIFEKKQYLGFPRPNGHCKAHDLSFIKEIIEDLASEPELVLQENFDTRKEVLSLLIEKDYDLVYGDLLFFEGFDAYRNDGLMIFDGIDIIPLNYNIDDYGCLPSKFTVIENNVPINYWSYSNNQKGICHNCIIWLNITNIKDQLLKNINFIERDYGIGSVQTTFLFNNKEYNIFIGIDDLDKWDNGEDIFNRYKEIFIKEELLCLDCEDVFDLFSDQERKENSLFMNLDFFEYHKNKEY